MGIQRISHTLRVGLTGGIGSGKTTASDMFAEFGVPVIDADDIAHKLARKGQPAYDAIVDEFGSAVIGPDGELRRDYLRKLVFTDEILRNRLESIIHPLVHDTINNFINNVSHPYCIISIPLLFETGAENTVDRVLVIDAPEILQIKRAMTRDNTTNQGIQKIIHSQMNREQRLKQTDDVICNDNSIKKLQSEVNSMHKKYLGLATV
ncbi:MAG: dephospho-CoA kinase [Proteobacteria bacterium]|nr:dephospho-CoA kinase [Pseudomonadota bacterium]